MIHLSSETWSVHSSKVVKRVAETSFVEHENVDRRSSQSHVLCSSPKVVPATYSEFVDWGWPPSICARGWSFRIPLSDLWSCYLKVKPSDQLRQLSLSMSNLEQHRTAGLQRLTQTIPGHGFLPRTPKKKVYSTQRDLRLGPCGLCGLESMPEVTSQSGVSRSHGRLDDLGDQD